MNPATKSKPNTDAEESLPIARCPRCHANPINPTAFPAGDGGSLGTHMSHAEVDDEGFPGGEDAYGVKRVLICSDCDRGELTRRLVEGKWQCPPVSEWPLSVEELVAEDRVRIEMGRTEYQS